MYRDWQYPHLKCSVCLHVPSENDLFNGWGLEKCPVCGKKACYECLTKKKCCIT